MMQSETPAMGGLPTGFDLRGGMAHNSQSGR